MADGINSNGGAIPTEHYRNLSDTPPLPPDDTNRGDPVSVVVQEDADAPPENIVIVKSDS